MLRFVHFIVFICLSGFIAAQVSSSSTLQIDYSNPRDYEIGGITVSGVKYYEPTVIIHLSGLKVGDKITVPGENISHAIEKLWKQGLFSDIKIYATQIVGSTIFLDIELKERPRLSKFSFTGVSKSEADDLREKIKLMRGTQVTDNTLITAKNTVRKHYVDKGYYNATVDIIQKDDTTMANTVILDIVVNKNKKVKINQIKFDGNTYLTESKLRRSMKDTKIKMWYRFYKVSKFVPENFEKDKENIIAKYQENGYRDAAILWDTVYRFNENLLNIEMKIDEGRKYFFRNITWVGNTMYTSDVLSQVLGIKKGDIYDQKVMNNKLYVSENAVSSLYLDEGYLFFSVTPVEVLVENDSIDLEMRIYEGKQAVNNRIIITGNTRTNEHVVRRELRTKPGQLFCRSDIIRSNRELATLGFFDPEKLDVKPTPNPSDGTVDLEYIVEEKASDQIELSGGWGGGMVIGTLGLTFNNFSVGNIFNKEAWKPLPTGDGQKLMIRAQTNGKYYQAYSLSFVEPWLGGKKPNSLSVSLYHTIRSLGTSLLEIDQFMKVSGVSVGLGRRIQWPDDFFVLSHDLSYQRYALKNFTGYFLFSNGKSNNISLTNTLSRNSMDQPIYPRRGSLFSISMQLTPPYSLFDNYDYSKMTDNEKYKWIEYHKWKFKSSVFTNLIDKLVLNTRAEFGYLGFYNSEIGPSPFESFQLGGDGLSGYSYYGTEIIGLRGYDNGPSNRGSLTPPKGGNLYDKFTLELRYPLSLNPSATIYVHTFVEGGNAWYAAKEFNPFDIKRSAGVGFRIFLPMIGVLGLDWGYGFDQIPNQPDANRGHFAFVIGPQF